MGRGSLCFAQPWLPRACCECALLGLATVTTAVIFTTDTADARRHRRHVRHEARTSYSPAFASIIVDANSGATLQSNNPDAIRHPASLTKIMTLYLLFERLEAGKMKLDTEMDVSEHASEQAPTKLGLQARPDHAGSRTPSRASSPAPPTTPRS